MSHNAAARGGAIHVFLAGTLTIANSTISSNLAAVEGGRINNASGTITITKSTISDNTAARGGALHNPSGTVTLLHTIVANSPQERNCFGPSIVSLGHNLDSGSTCGFSGPGDLTNTDPLLGTLADNGGSTLTHALLHGSPAIDTGDNAGCPATDQRGLDRLTDGDGDGAAGCDVGAYEAGESVMLEIAAVSPTKGGNAGSVTIVVQGGGFDSDAVVRLVDGSQVVLTGQNTIVNPPTKIQATFDLQGQVAKALMLEVVNPDGTSVISPEPFTIVDGGEGKLTLDLIGPAIVRVGREAKFFAVIRNEGLVDIKRIWLDLTVSQSTPPLTRFFDVIDVLSPGTTNTSPIPTTFPPGCWQFGGEVQLPATLDEVINSYRVCLEGNHPSKTPDECCDEIFDWIEDLERPEQDPNHRRQKLVDFYGEEAVVKFHTDLVELYNEFCVPQQPEAHAPQQTETFLDVCAVTSWDPNDKSGAAGPGDAKYVQRRKPIAIHCLL